MVIIKKKEITENKISYYYDPNGKGKIGIINYYPKENKYETEILSEMEDENFAFFRRHVWTALKEFYLTGNYPEEKTIKWY